MKAHLILTVVLLVTSGKSYAEDSSIFAGKFAKCVGSGLTTDENWRFIGVTNEYVKQFKLGSAKIEQRGKYSFKADTLTLQEYKSGTTDIDSERKFKLKAKPSTSGFEYIWVAPNGSKTPYTCKWQ